MSSSRNQSIDLLSKWMQNTDDQSYVTMLYAQRCIHRSSPSEVFLGRSLLKLCSKFTGEHPCRSTISIKLLCNFIEIALRHWCSPVNLLHIFWTSFHKKTSGRLLLYSAPCQTSNHSKSELLIRVLLTTK